MTMGKKTSIGKRTIHALIYGTNKTKTFKSKVIREQTLAKGYPVYHFTTPSGEHRNTSRKGIYGGVVLTKSEARTKRKRRK